MVLSGGACRVLLEVGDAGRPAASREPFCRRGSCPPLGRDVFSLVSGRCAPWPLLPAIAAAAMYFALPDSPRFLAASRQRVRWTALFSPELRRDTIAASLVFLTNIFVVYAFFNWAPLVMTALGFDLRVAMRGALVF